MKKFLSMALALVMTLSLCTFIAAPEADAAFTDSDQLSSKYAQQAADVIQTIEVMDGYDDGTFRPAAGLTRQAAAKIICNMVLGPTTARALPTNANPFPDVLAGNQFSGYISYCSQQGIISGYADGTFRGGDPLSGYAFLKMLLGALGYGQQEEGFVGDNWKVNVAKLALGIGLTKRDVDGSDSDFDGTVQVTREDAAIYAFNTLQADMVEYSSANTLEINGVKVTMGSATAAPQTWNTSSTSANNINAETSDGANRRPIVQFAERYFDRLRREPNVWNTYTQDDFGRPSIRWFWKGVEVGTYSRDPDVSFVGGVDVNVIYSGLQMTSGDDQAHLYINSSIPNNARLNVSRSNDKGLGDFVLKDGNGNSSDVYGDGNHRVDRIGDGTIIECFRNDANNHVDVCVISVYGGKVNGIKGATTKKDAYVTIDYSQEPEKRPNTINLSGNNEFETTDFMEDDVVAYTYSDSAQEIKSMYKMSSASGVLQSRVAGKSLRLDSTTYKYGKEYTFDDIQNFENGLSSKSSYIVYLDENDFVLWVEEDEFAVDQYVLIERISIETTSDPSYGGTGSRTTTASVIGDMESAGALADPANTVAMQSLYQQSKAALGTSAWDARARLRYSNGTVRTVTLDDSKNYRTSIANDAANFAAAGAYTVVGNNIYLGAAIPANLVDPADYPVLSGFDTGSTGDGNWIAAPFTAGNIVRVSNSGSTYKLHSLRDSNVFVVTNFGINNHVLGTQAYNVVPETIAYSNTNAVGETFDQVPVGTANSRNLIADSETHFVIEDLANNTWKTYIGVKNAPDVSKAAYNSTAYIYHNNGVAKLIYVRAATISSSGNDIVFLVANSVSNLITATDVSDYYTVSAVEKNEIKTIMLRAGRTFTMNGITFTPGAAGNDSETRCVVLNDVTYDSNDLMDRGRWDPTSDALVGQAQGVRRVNSEEVRLDTAPNRNSFLRDVADNIRVYYVDGDDIKQISVSEIVNDTMDMVYYVEDDGELTYLFIVDYEEEAEEVVEGARTRFADGELQILDPSGSQTHFAYHYTGNNAASGTVITAFQNYQAAQGFWGGVGSVTVTSDGYQVVYGGITYTIDVVRDAYVPVVGTIPAFSTITGSLNFVGPVVPAGFVAPMSGEKVEYALYTPGSANGPESGFIPGTDVTFSVIPVFGTNSVTITVTDTANPAVTYQTETVQLASPSDGATPVEVTITVPSANFTVAFASAV